MCELYLWSRYTASSKLGNLRASYGWKDGGATKEEFGNTALACRGGARKIKVQVGTWMSRARKSFYYCIGRMRTGNVFLGTWSRRRWPGTVSMNLVWINPACPSRFTLVKTCLDLRMRGEQWTSFPSVLTRLWALPPTGLFKLGGCGGMVVVWWATRGVKLWLDDGAQRSCLVGSALSGGGSKWRIAGVCHVRRSCLFNSNRWRHPVILELNCSFWL